MCNTNFVNVHVANGYSRLLSNSVKQTKKATNNNQSPGQASLAWHGSKIVFKKANTSCVTWMLKSNFRFNLISHSEENEVVHQHKKPMYNYLIKFCYLIAFCRLRLLAAVVVCPTVQSWLVDTRNRLTKWLLMRWKNHRMKVFLFFFAYSLVADMFQVILTIRLLLW